MYVKFWESKLKFIQARGKTVFFKETATTNLKPWWVKATSLIKSSGIENDN